MKGEHHVQPTCDCEIDRIGLRHTIGGCDIIREMFQNGELETLLADKGIERQPAA